MDDDAPPFPKLVLFLRQRPILFFLGGKGGIEKQIPRRLEMDSDSGVVKNESLKKNVPFFGGGGQKIDMTTICRENIVFNFADP